MRISLLTFLSGHPVVPYSNVTTCDWKPDCKNGEALCKNTIHLILSWETFANIEVVCSVEGWKYSRIPVEGATKIIINKITATKISFFPKHSVCEVLCVLNIIYLFHSIKFETSSPPDLSSLPSFVVQVRSFSLSIQNPKLKGVKSLLTNQSNLGYVYLFAMAKRVFSDLGTDRHHNNCWQLLKRTCFCWLILE